MDVCNSVLNLEIKNQSRQSMRFSEHLVKTGVGHRFLANWLVSSRARNIPCCIHRSKPDRLTPARPADSSADLPFALLLQEAIVRRLSPLENFAQLVLDTGRAEASENTSPMESGLTKRTVFGDIHSFHSEVRNCIRRAVIETKCSVENTSESKSDSPKQTESPHHNSCNGYFCWFVEKGQTGHFIFDNITFLENLLTSDLKMAHAILARVKHLEMC